MLSSRGPDGSDTGSELGRVGYFEQFTYLTHTSGLISPVPSLAVRQAVEWLTNGVRRGTRKHQESFGNAQDHACPLPYTRRMGACAIFRSMELLRTSDVSDKSPPS